ncbi:hypothetical protein Agabi119p4_4383 [Agaricus bisporus var. burnettii]|uniref:Uncharacterized protein n=1 Tax=Agaricus bisporus var. burnettii TaxID=192524 RepID=A0A8H7F3B9_AGABI|nr:hypothetical protein Agabi119p4_4383 [Agaricus bisporus var. burnettii]
MRRLVAVFSSKRDKSDSKSKAASSPPRPPPHNKLLHLPLTLPFTSSPPAPSPSSITSTPQLSSSSDRSSTRSASVYAPAAEDEYQPASLSRDSTKRSWKDWLGGKRVSSDPSSIPELPYKASEPPRRTRIGRSSTFQVLSRSVREIDDTQKVSLEEDYGHKIFLAHSDYVAPATKPSLATSPTKAQQNLKMLITNSLIPSLPASPFVQPSPTYLYPRSCNRPQALSTKSDIRRLMLKRRLLGRLEKHSPDDAAIISPFGSKNPPVPITASTLPDYEASLPPSTTLVFRASPGIRRWISRPCFEDRFSVFLPSNDGVCQIPVTSALAVAALEYPESLDVLVDPDFDLTLAQPVLSQGVPCEPSLEGLPKTSPPLAEKTSPPATINPRASFTLSPSPLRNQHNSKPVSSLVTPNPLSAVHPPVSASGRRSLPSGSSSPQPTPVSPLAQPAVLAPIVKRAVRFAEDDAEDVEPLHLLRQKKMREEKAKFLRTEQRRRLMQQEQERRRIEAERIEQEKRRWSREKEKKEMEQRQYAEMVTAQRARRESQRAGIIPGLKMDDNHLLLPSASSTSLRDTERRRSHDKKRSSPLPSPSSLASLRGASESNLSPSVFDSSGHRGGSVGYSPNGSNSGHGYQSRPSSMYSSSSDGGRSKRQSTIPNNSGMPFMDRAASYPVWSASNQSLHHNISGVAPSPELMNDSLLLPPSAPFMMRQHSRQSRSSSPGRSHSSGSLNANSATSSSERVNVYRQHPSRSPDAYPSPPSPGTSPGKSSHMRPEKKDSRNSSVPTFAPTRGSTHRTKLPPQGFQQLPRPQVAQYTQFPSPWTALPTEHGNLPTAMPVSPYSRPPGTAMNRGSNDSFKRSVTGQNMKKNHGAKR